ncbi:Tripartite tricarboxylate transporter TctB family protein [Natronoarchaeum philippinense]|uniref:Tripartite tricarboxylate transporter TctB family protein n=1 Tax=Natronoarchaeum philippinense TaxID=558529 RepID=A0A285NRD3_NATPI|nr:tripartite tricarboxylate transporter TctB family protein [Natronoarchaeum philippinense]SNZ12035.1 Tripartite tricarboxylate transporter TctB family protein [Natronoarchaeum philippinense]
MPVEIGHTDKISSVLLLALSAGVFVVSGDFPRGPGITGPAFFPRVISVLIAAFALAQLGKRLYVSRVRSYEITHEVAVQVFAVFGLVVAYVLALPWIGFVPATIAFLLAAMWYSGVGSLPRAVVVAVGVTLALYYTFIVFLRVPLPEGVFVPVRPFLPSVVGWSP